jgi:ubiquinone/menaquinone biosynthesis C-methylase UbiE
VTSLNVHQIYERWAPGYLAKPHNPLMVSEQRAMLERLPALEGRIVLDLACGTGRYAEIASRSGAARCVGVDFSAAMLARARIDIGIRADMTQLPLRSAVFDVVLSGLAMGHASDLTACLREVARVMRPGGVLLYSDFHPEATQRGLTRSFRDEGGTRLTLPAQGPPLAAHRDALAAAGFTEIEVHEIRAGLEFNEDFPGASRFYADWRGVPLILVVRARRGGRP